jgi:hypothetical protein
MNSAGDADKRTRLRAGLRRGRQQSF